MCTSLYFNLFHSFLLFPLFVCTLLPFAGWCERDRGWLFCLWRSQQGTRSALAPTDGGMRSPHLRAPRSWSSMTAQVRKQFYVEAQREDPQTLLPGCPTRAWLVKIYRDLLKVVYPKCSEASQTHRAPLVAQLERFLTGARDFVKRSARYSSHKCPWFARANSFAAVSREKEKHHEKKLVLRLKSGLKENSGKAPHVLSSSHVKKGEASRTHFAKTYTELPALER